MARNPEGKTASMSNQKIYSSILEKIFFSKFKKGMTEIEFEREDIVKFGNKLKIDLPKNLGDLIYSFRYRAALPDNIKSHAREDEMWIIRPAGRAKYRFVLIPSIPLTPNKNLITTKVPDATP